MPAVKIERDEYGALYRVQAFTPDIASLDVRKNPGRRLTAIPHIDVWWDRDAIKRDDELLLLRQVNGDKRADVITLTMGQAYDLLHAVGSAIKDI